MTSMKLLAPLGKAAFISSARTFAFFPSSHRRGIATPVGMPLTPTMSTSAEGDDATRPPALVDVDCNLLHADLSSFMGSASSVPIDGDVDDALRVLHHPSTAKSNIAAMISPSSTVDESERSVRLLESSTDRQRNDVRVKTTVGVHPYHAREAGPPGPETLARIRRLLDDPHSERFVSCIGETGLDYSEGFPGKEHQIPWFRAQLDLAFERGLPVFLHERMAFEDTLRCIDEAAERHAGRPTPRIIVHCFTGSFEECEEYMKRDYVCASVSGYVCKAGAGSDEVKKCLREGVIPLDRLMLETDAPYMGFAGNKDSFFEEEGEAFTSLSSKKRKRLKSMYPNVPSSLPLVLRTVRDELNLGRRERGEVELSLDDLARITTENACDFFGIDGIINQT